MNIVPVLLFVWLFVQFVQKTWQLQWLLFTLFITTLISQIFFLAVSWGVAPSLFLQGAVMNTVSLRGSIFGMYTVAVSMLALGMCLWKVRARELWLPALTLLVSLLVLLRLGFFLNFILLAVGTGFLLVIGFLFFRDVRVSILGGAIGVFVAAILFAIVGAPQSLKASVPVEVSLGSSPSWTVVESTLLQNPKNFFIGSGLGTFIYDFSLFRPAAFNLDPLVWSIRFASPYSTFFALLAEGGVLVSMSFVVLILLSAGIIFYVWSHHRNSFFSALQERVAGGQSQYIYYSGIFFSAWIVLTVGLFFSFFDMTLWWLWWLLLGFHVVGSSFTVPEIITEKVIPISVSPQYRLVLAFGTVTLFTVLTIAASFGLRGYMAEAVYSKSLNQGSRALAYDSLQKAVAYRSHYAPYHLALARWYLEEARNAYVKNPQDVNTIASFLGQAVNSAKFATGYEPKDVATWETLATLYINVRSFAPQANQWAREGLQTALLLEPTNGVLIAQLGETYVFDKNLDEAEKWYRRAIETNPNYIPAYVQLSNVLEAKGQVDEAIALHEPLLLNLAPNNTSLLFNLGRLFYNRNKKGDIDQAEQIWKRVAELDPRYSDALYSLGLLYEKTGDRVKAIQYFQRVRELNPKNSDIAEKLKSLVR